MHPVTTATIDALRAFVFPAYGRKSKPPALRVVVDFRPMDPSTDRPNLPAMIADATLGRLCKWLRMTGIDAAWDSATPDPVRLRQLAENNRRWVLTRSHKVFDALGPERCVLLHPDKVQEQIRQVVQHFGITRRDLQPLTRCTLCNQSMFEISRQSVIGQVPDYVWQSQDRFMRCACCMRVYWHGSHAERIQSMVDLWFG